MSYDAIVYLFVFLPVSLVLYQLTPRRHRWKTLLAESGVFFWMLSGMRILWLFGAGLLTHCTGIWLAWLRTREKEMLAGEEDREQKKRIKQLYQKNRRRVLALGVVLLLAVLISMKYHNFFVRSLDMLPFRLPLPVTPEERNIILPVGISFYTLQAIGYMADVYWGKNEPEEKPGRTLLFLGFFPQIMEGPICRWSDTADRLFAGEPLQGRNLSEGYVRIFWGLFKKKIVADRLAVPVAAIFDNYTQYSGVLIAVGAIAYTIQLYMEFSGCMDIIIGSGKLFGICLPENFRQPFCARSAAEFWRRWHITLGTWFKTYIFYPVSMSSLVKRWNQFGRKHLGKEAAQLGVAGLALFPVWICNGLWHGPRWSYIFYGMYYFALIFAGEAVKPLRRNVLSVCHINEDSRCWHIVQTAKTWGIIFVGELFFRADGLRAGISMFGSLFRDFGVSRLWDGTLLDLGLGKADLAAVAGGCLVAAVVGHILERRPDAQERLAAAPTPLRWAVYYGLILSVVLFAAYGDGYQAVDMIYAGF